MKQKFILLWIVLLFVAVYMFLQREYFSTAGNVLIGIFVGFFVLFVLLPLFGWYFFATYNQKY
jgi:hypothetical protein